MLFPVHPNPAVRGPAEAVLGSLDDVILCEPLDYFTMVQALDLATLVLTDSGGLQEEAPALGKPVLVLRSKTERPEAVESGVARLVGTSAPAIEHAVNELLDDPAVYRTMARGDSPYGDGRAAQRAVAALLGEAVPFFEAIVGAGRSRGVWTAGSCRWPSSATRRRTHNGAAVWNPGQPLPTVGGQRLPRATATSAAEVPSAENDVGDRSQNTFVVAERRPGPPPGRTACSIAPPSTSAATPTRHRPGACRRHAPRYRRRSRRCHGRRGRR